MNEPAITVNGKSLTEAQAMAVRVAVTDLQSRMSEKDALGSDSVGEGIRRGYQERAGEVVRIMLTPPPSTHVGAVLNKACEAFSEAYSVYPDGRGKTSVTDWFELDAEDAVSFGVLKSPHWSSHSDIRSDEYREYIAAVIREPMRAALNSILKDIPPPAPNVAVLAKALRDLELANDNLCGARPQKVYDAMIAAGMSDRMTELDEARRNARAALATTEGSEG
jgi:hypothetical protein